MVLDAGGRKSKKRYTEFGQDIRYSHYLMHWLCVQLGIPVYTDPIKVPARSGKMVVTDNFLNWFDRCSPDLVLMSTFGYLIPESLFELVDNWWINFHPAERGVNWPDTEFRGPRPYPKMLASGVDLMVVVAYFIDGEYDRGAYLAKSEARSLREVVDRRFGEVRMPRDHLEWFQLLTNCHETMAGPTAKLFSDLSLALSRGLSEKKRNSAFTIEQFKAQHEAGFFSS